MTQDTPLTSPDGLVPNSSRLLHGVRGALADIAAKSEDPATRYLLGAADVALNELMLRENMAFYADVFGQLRKLSAEGLVLLESTLADAARRSLSVTLAALPAEVPVSTGYAALSRHLRDVLACGVPMIEAASASQDPTVRDWRKRLLEAERELHDYGAGQAIRPAAATTRPRPFPAREEVQAYLRRRFPDRGDLVVTSFRRLVGGFQKLTILFDTEDRKQGKQLLVMRAEKDERFMKLGASDIRDEYRIVTAVHAAGVPTAEPLWLESDMEKLGRRFLVSRRVAGENLGTAVSTDKAIPESTVRSFVDTLAAIHRVPLATALEITGSGTVAQHPSVAALAHTNIESWERQPYMAVSNPSPILARIMTWLHANAPREDATPCLIHRDYGPHNILVDNGAVSAVLDWESAQVGDPAEDLSYFIQCTAAQTNRESVIAMYEEASGRRISEYRLRYYDVFNLIKIIIGSLAASAMYELETEAGVEWNLLAFKYVSVVAGSIEEKIALAEKVCG